MKTGFLLVAAMAMAVGCQHPAVRSFSSATDISQAGQMQQLLAEVTAALPSGWTAEIWPGSAAKPSVRWNSPYLLVSRAKNAQAYVGGINSAGRAADEPEPEGEMMPVAFKFTCIPFVTEAQYQNLAETNNTRHAARQAAFESVKSLPYSWMGAEVPPNAFAPANDEQRKLLLEYAFVWLNTEQTLLPDYRYRKLSLCVDFMEDYVFTEPGVGAEVSQVAARLRKILEKY